jgi:hypothetical protein
MDKLIDDNLIKSEKLLKIIDKPSELINPQISPNNTQNEKMKFAFILKIIQTGREFV